MYGVEALRGFASAWVDTVIPQKGIDTCSHLQRLGMKTKLEW